MNDAECEKIANIIKEREIKYLVHFTPMQNLNSILENGLYSRNFIENSDTIHGIYLDSFRVDNRCNGICLSISFPNHFLFWHHRKRLKGYWAIIYLDIDLILKIKDRQIEFFDTNAANSKFKNISSKFLESAECFHGLFADIILNKKDGKLIRNNYLLPRDPTDVQAEIIIAGHIEKEYICRIFINELFLSEYQNKYPLIEFISGYDNYLMNYRENSRKIGFNL